MIKKLFIYMALILGLAACSDEIFDGPRDTIPENGEIPISFVVPEMIKSGTRAGTFDPDAVGTVTMLVYNGEAGDLIYQEDLTATEKVSITIPKKYRQNKNLYFVFFTNDSRNADTFKNADNQNISHVFAQTGGILSADGNSLVMSGVAKLSQLLQMEPVVLTRSAAKITVSSWDEPEKDFAQRDKFPFKVYGIGTNTHLLAGLYETLKKPALSNPSAKTYTEFENTENLGKEVYVNPTLNTGNSKNQCFVIVKVQYPVDKKWYYYCLNFQDKDGEMNILPNHYYDFQIKTSTMRAGYETPEEAAKNPVPLSSGMYLVVDHSPKVFNIISDGMRTLGVTGKLSCQANAGGTEYLYVRLVSNATSAADDYDYFYKNYKECIKFRGGWVTLGNSITEAEADDEVGTLGSNYSKPDNYLTSTAAGKLYKIPVIFSGSATGLLETQGTVTWKGLSRNFEVEWNRVFDPTQIYDNVATSLSGGSYHAVTFEDYFKTLSGRLKKDGTYEKYPDVWGASAEDNDGEARDQGLHFPMPYGNTSSSYATANHVVTLKDFGDGTEYSWTYEVQGDPVITNNISITNTNSSNTALKTLKNEKPVLTVTLNSKNAGWAYGVGKIVITVKQGETETPIEIPLYHTGFFHQDNTSSADLAKGVDIGNLPTRTWTYYEVVEMEGLHWLDRNLGAHSANMYVEATGDVTYAGDAAAAGGYYRVADYHKGYSPYMRDGNEGRSVICPPGFDYPTKDEYDKIRKSSKFSTAVVGSYNDASYVADEYNTYVRNRDAEDGVKRKVVYFPRSRYLGGDNSKKGESRSGYYWTSTASSGLEKEEVGAWLNCFALSGANASFMNGEVYCSSASTTGNSTRTGEIPGFAMPVRCVANETTLRKPGDMHRTSFFVTGATHVFLYTIDSNGEKVACTTWPGYAICTAGTSSKTYNFSYESRINDTKDLYVIFNYKAANGQIQTISRNVDKEYEQDQTIRTGKDEYVKYTDNIGMKELTGFKVSGGVAPDWAKYGTETKTTSNGCYWNFNFNNGSNYKGGIGTSGQGGDDYENRDYRIYFHKNATKFYLFFNGEDAFVSVSESQIGSVPKDRDYYYKDFTKSTQEENKTLKFDNGKANKELGVNLSGFTLVDGKYCAYLDDSNNGHAGKPSGGGGNTDDRWGSFAANTRFYIHGSMTADSWATTEMFDNDEDGVWEVTITPTRSNWEFGIKANDDWHYGTSNGSISYDAEMTVVKENNNNGKNWSDTGTNKLTFKFCPKTMKLIVSKESGGDDPGKTVPSGTYRIYWNKKLGTDNYYPTMEYWTGGSNTTMQYQGEIGNYYYRDFTTNKVHFHFKNDQNAEYNADGGGWWQLNSDSDWGSATGGGKAVYVEKYNSINKGIPSSLPARRKPTTAAKTAVRKR